jgi:hypothetical protein
VHFSNAGTPLHLFLRASFPFWLPRSRCLKKYLLIHVVYIYNFSLYIHEFHITQLQPLLEQFLVAQHRHRQYHRDIGCHHPCRATLGVATFTNYIAKELLAVITRSHFDSYANKICNVCNILQYSIIFYKKYMNLYINKSTSHIFIQFSTIP